MSGTLKVWNAAEQVQHADLNANFALLQSQQQQGASGLQNSITQLQGAVGQLNPAAQPLNMNGHKVTNLTPGAAATDAVAFGQLADVYEGTFSIVNGVIVMPLQSATMPYRVDVRGIAGPAGQNIVFFTRVSTDGGLTFHQGASDYSYLINSFAGVSGAPVNATTGQASYVPITQAVPRVSIHGSIFVDPMNLTISSILQGPYTTDIASGVLNLAGSTITSVIIGAVGVSISIGSVRTVRQIF